MSAARRRLEPAQRRAQLLEVALEAFRENGVANTSVSDIVKRAGVAQGTFYLYFDSKEDAVCAVVSASLEEIAERFERAVALPNATAVERLFVLRDALVEMNDEPYEHEMHDLFHRPENREIHDRVTGGFAPRVQPILAQIIEQGIDEGVFETSDPGTAAWYVLGAYSALEIGVDRAADMGAGIERLTEFVLRGLGYSVTTSGVQVEHGS